MLIMLLPLFHSANPAVEPTWRALAGDAQEAGATPTPTLPVNTGVFKFIVSFDEVEESKVIPPLAEFLIVIGIVVP
tara:strand:- start:944 stop:1171 length:228 start_codon:yes stop_codon:yes gene_type:complete